MKGLKSLIIMSVLLGACLNVQAHKVKVYPRHGTVVTKIYHPRIVVHKGATFHYANGVWYKPYGRRYKVCRAPIGIKIRFVPRGYMLVRINGKKYYHLNGIWYAKKGGYYTVVRVS